MSMLKLLHSQQSNWRKKITCGFKISRIFTKVPNILSMVVVRIKSHIVFVKPACVVWWSSFRLWGESIWLIGTDNRSAQTTESHSWEPKGLTSDSWPIKQGDSTDRNMVKKYGTYEGTFLNLLKKQKEWKMSLLRQQNK